MDLQLAECIRALLVGLLEFLLGLLVVISGLEGVRQRCAGRGQASGPDCQGRYGYTNGRSQGSYTLRCQRENRGYGCDGPGELPSSNSEGVEGLAVSPSGILFASVGSQGLVKAFKIPEPTAPEIISPSVRGITTETAKLGARVKPGFLPTDVRVEYGPADCASNPCTRTRRYALAQATRCSIPWFRISRRRRDSAMRMRVHAI